MRLRLRFTHLLRSESRGLISALVAVQEYESIRAIKKLAEADQFTSSLCGKTIKVLNQKEGDGNPAKRGTRTARQQGDRAVYPRVFYQVLVNSSQEKRNPVTSGNVTGVAPFMTTTWNQVEELRKKIPKGKKRDTAGAFGFTIHRKRESTAFCGHNKCMLCGWAMNHLIRNPSGDSCCLDEIL